ncbi:MAG: FeoB-associated Cys-rich membrane protein [Clostridiales bacterium]|nr:FeoB-associated Cys-rich membrane protein [Clostridiales bacterium]
MTNLIVILILCLIVGASAFYIIKAKKQGQKCIGCPYARECASKGCGRM